MFIPTAIATELAMQRAADRRGAARNRISFSLPTRRRARRARAAAVPACC